MAEAKHQGFLGAVYDARSPKEVADLYDGWAKTYDADMADKGYRHPSTCVALLARHVFKGTGPLLDAGAGTGLTGQWLQTLGYLNVEALDISAGMLDVARQKNCYNAFHKLALGGSLPFADGAYASVISAGVFTSGHVGADGLDELVRICQSGGFVVLTVKDALWKNGFSAHVDQMVKAGVVEIAELTEPYVSMPGEEGTSPSRGLALRVS